MAGLDVCLGLVAPYYNLVLVAFVIGLFLFLFKNAPKKLNIKPWKLLCIAVMIFVLEEILTVFNDADIISVHRLVAPLLEMVIIGLFTYMLLLQKEIVNRKR